MNNFKPEISKPQWLRLWDVFVLGPVLIYAGGRKSNLPVGLRFIIATSGLLTIYYNGRNYLINQQQARGPNNLVQWDTPLSNYPLAPTGTY